MNEWTNEWMKIIWFIPMNKLPWFTKAAFSLSMGDKQGQMQNNTQSIQSSQKK